MLLYELDAVVGANGDGVCTDSERRVRIAVAEASAKLGLPETNHGAGLRIGEPSVRRCRDRRHHETRRRELALVLLTIEIEIKVARLEDAKKLIRRVVVAFQEVAVARSLRVVDLSREDLEPRRCSIETNIDPTPGGEEVDIVLDDNAIPRTAQVLAQDRHRRKPISAKVGIEVEGHG
ncbi:MAG: hypothetical protein AB7T06_38625 [Kofleriaceae bacterium]